MTAWLAVDRGTPHQGVTALAGVGSQKGEEANPIKGKAADDESQSVFGRWLVSTLDWLAL